MIFIAGKRPINISSEPDVYNFGNRCLSGCRGKSYFLTCRQQSEELIHVGVQSNSFSLSSIVFYFSQVHFHSQTRKLHGYIVKTRKPGYSCGLWAMQWRLGHEEMPWRLSWSCTLSIISYTLDDDMQMDGFKPKRLKGRTRGHNLIILPSEYYTQTLYCKTNNVSKKCQHQNFFYYKMFLGRTQRVQFQHKSK